MTVAFEKDIFAPESSVTDTELDKLWHIIEGPHKLLLRNSETIEAIRDSSWYQNARPIIRKVLDELALWSVQSPKSIEARIQISNFDDAVCFSVAEAIRYLNQPFVLVLENSKNDAYFIDALLRCFPKQAATIVKHKREGWFEYGMGGGSTIPDFIKTKLQAFGNPNFKKEKWKYLRLFVLLDSDRTYPEMSMNKGKTELIAFLTQNEIPHHILEKRAMENYIPDEAVDEIPDNREFIDAYLTLSPLQKDYFNLRNGFPKKFEQLEPTIQQLYKSISAEHKNIFRKNNLSKINKSEKENFKSEFPKQFNKPAVTRETLLARCKHHSTITDEHPYNPNELPDLLQKINEWL